MEKVFIKISWTYHLEGKNGMYVFESPLLLGSGIAIVIPMFLVWLLFLLNIFKTKGRSQITQFLGFLAAIFFFFSYLLGGVLRLVMLPAVASVDLSLPYSLWSWALAGIGAFFTLLYGITVGYPDLLYEKMWIILIPIIVSASWFAVLFLFTNTTTVTSTVIAGVNFLVMPLFVSVYSLILIVFYIGIIPLYCGYRYTTLENVAGTAVVKWVRLFILGGFLFFIGIILEAIQIIEILLLAGRFLISLAWIILLIAYLLIGRSSQ
jgi:hypothetical protein